jgi:diacylglycerol kinase family enzyme
MAAPPGAAIFFFAKCFMRRRFALVFNSTAGHAIPRLLDSVIAGLRDNGADVFQLPARNADEAAERVRDVAHRRTADAVIAAGGDGTFRAVATGAAGSDLAIGIIPIGTGNVLAHEIGLHARTQPIVDLLLSGNEIGIRGGLFNGAPFFLMTGAGFDARIVSRLDYKTKRAFGRAAYVNPILSSLAEPPQVFDVELDGRRFEASWVILSFASRYGSVFTLTRETGVGLNTLMAVVIEASTRVGLAKSALSIGLGRLARAKGIQIMPVKVARIGRQSRVPLEVDGDGAGLSPADVRAEGPGIRLIVPPAYVADLTNRHANRLDCES